MLQIQASDGCLLSDFDQFGDMEAFGVHPDWQRQLTKFASVQDRLREWRPDVIARIKVFACLAIKALDIDAIRIDKATQVTLDALASWSTNTRSCAAKYNKSNFFIAGEVTGGDTFGSLYMYVSPLSFRYHLFLMHMSAGAGAHQHSFLRASWQLPTSLQIKISSFYARPL